jgi:hypothetical protein
LNPYAARRIGRAQEVFMMGRAVALPYLIIMPPEVPALLISVGDW